MLDLKDAATFLRLCETANLSRTALLCKVSPSTLSRTLSKLEQELGVKLCVRDKKGVSITAEGRRFEQFARTALDDFAVLKRDLGKGENHLSGVLKIFCSVTASYLFIPRILNELRLSEPGLELKLETGDPADALDRLNDSLFDLVISALPGEVPAHIEYVDLVHLPLILIAPKKPLFDAAVNEADPASLSTVPFVMPQKGQLRYEVSKWFSAQEIKPKIYAEIAGHEAIVSMAALGFGVAVVPKLVYDLSPFKNDVSVIKTLPWSYFRVALCHLKSRSAEPAIRAVHNLTKNISASFEADLSRRRADTPI